MNPEEFSKQYPEVTKISNPYGHEDLEGFAKYIGVDLEELLRIREKDTRMVEDIDFDDYSR